MTWLKQLFSRRRLYGDLSEEIREHLEEKIEELVAGGMSREEAAYAAAANLAMSLWLNRTAAPSGDGQRLRIFSRMSDLVRVCSGRTPDLLRLPCSHWRWASPPTGPCSVP